MNEKSEKPIQVLQQIPKSPMIDSGDFISELSDESIIIAADETAIGKRIDTFAAEQSGLSRSRIAVLIELEKVFVNGKPVKKRYTVQSGDNIEINCPAPTDIAAKPENIPIEIVYEDEELLVVNKPRGMVVHPAPGHYTGTLVNALLWHCRDSLSGINGCLRPGIVHRIDRNTSGLLIVAKSDRAHIGLAAQIKEHSFTRKYKAIIYGAPENDEGSISFSIGRSLRDRKKMAAFPENTKNTKPALTYYKVLEHFTGYSFIEATLMTGRTHQIRVHFSAIGHPVVGDDLYAAGRNSLGLDGQCLHAAVIGFVHPISGQELYFEAPLPDYFTKTLEKIKKL